MGEGGVLYKVIRKVYNSSGAKLKVNSRERTVTAVGASCQYPLFLPLIVTLSETSTHSYKISQMSTTFAPDSSFLSVIGQPKSPFSVSQNQLASEVTVSVRDSIISVPLSSLARCNRYVNSQEYECEVEVRQEA